jgi:hypothetical protein
MRLEPFTGTIAEPITLAAAKLFLRVDSVSEDDLVTSLISSTREHIEATTGELLVSRQLVGVADAWPGSEAIADGLVSPRGIPMRDGMNDPLPPATAGTLEFTVRPVTAIAKIETVDLSGVVTEWDSSNYYLDKSFMVSRVAKRFGAVLPELRQTLGGIRVTFTAGWATPPDDLLLAMRIIMAHWYENRGVSVDTRATEIPFNADRILKRHRQVRP